MVNKYKTERLIIEGKALVYREERGYYWAYCPKTIEFYKFNKQGFAILLGISAGLLDLKITLRIKNNKSAQIFLYYLIKHEVITEKYLKELKILSI